MDIGTTSGLSAGILSTSTQGGDTQIDVNLKELNINGLHALGIYSTSSGGTGSTSVAFGQGKMNINGDDADGINIINYNVGGNVTVQQDGDINITAITTGTPTMFPNEAIWVTKANTQGNITITSTGNIDIKSNTATGIGTTAVSNSSSSITYNNTLKHINLESHGNSHNHSLIAITALGDGIGKKAQVDVTADYINVKGEGIVTGVSTIASNGADANINVTDTHYIKAISSSGIATAITATAANAGVVNINIVNTATTGTGTVSATGTNAIAVESQVNTGDTNILIDNFNVQGGAGVNGAGVSMTTAGGGKQILTNRGNIGADSDRAIVSTNTNTSGTTQIVNNQIITGYVNLSGNDVTFNNNQTGYFALQNFNSSTIKLDSNSYFGGAVNSTFNNLGIVAFSDKNNDGTLTHANFTGLATYNQAGIIDLTNNQHALAGNTLTISNGGTGDFISNGGLLYLNTNVSPDGVSDKLIVDNVTTGANGPTSIYITPTPNSIYGNLGSVGIEVVHVDGASSSDAFRLGQTVVNGAYGYGLFQGSAISRASWYLRNFGLNPVVGGYLANQTAATEMFGQQLRDRLLAMPTIQQSTSQLNTLWMRTKISHGSRRTAGNALNNTDRMYMTQLGSDIGVWQLSGGNLHVGMMAGYGDYKNTSKDRANKAKADSKLKGYSGGLYATWFQNEDANKGLYVDTWTQYGGFRNETKVKESTGNKKYNSAVWSSSIEAGYGLVLGTANNLQWTATPQAQLTYNYYHSKNLYDKANSLYVKDAQGNGLITRLGIRLQAKETTKSQPLEPFVEVNWVNSNAKNKIEFNGTDFADGMPHNRYEAKIGLQGNVTQKLNVSAQLGGLWGDNRYRQYQGQLNINYKF